MFSKATPTKLCVCNCMREKRNCTLAEIMNFNLEIKKSTKKDINSNNSGTRKGKTIEVKKEELMAIRNRFPTKIPIIVQRFTKESNLPQLDKSKFLVPQEITMSQFLTIIRNRMRIGSTQALYLLVNNRSMISLSATLAEVYTEYAGPDGFLYVTYASQEVFGCIGANNACQEVLRSTRPSDLTEEIIETTVTDPTRTTRSTGASSVTKPTGLTEIIIETTVTDATRLTGVTRATTKAAIVIGSTRSTGVNYTNTKTYATGSTKAAIEAIRTTSATRTTGSSSTTGSTSTTSSTRITGQGIEAKEAKETRGSSRTTGSTRTTGEGIEAKEAKETTGSTRTTGEAKETQAIEDVKETGEATDTLTVKETGEARKTLEAKETGDAEKTGITGDARGIGSTMVLTRATVATKATEAVRSDRVTRPTGTTKTTRATKTTGSNRTTGTTGVTAAASQSDKLERSHEYRVYQTCHFPNTNESHFTAFFDNSYKSMSFG